VLPQIVTVNPFMSTRRHRRRVKNTYRARRRRHNPESRRARSRAARAAYRHRRHNPFRHRRHRVHNFFDRRRRRNPLDAMVPDLTQDLTAALIGAGSAIALDVILAYAPIPANLSTGWGQVLVQGVGSVALGALASMAAGRRTGTLVTIGGLTITGYGALQMALGPTLGSHIRGFGGIADFSDYGRMGAYMGRPAAAALPNPGRVGAYMGPAARLSAQPAAPTTSLARKQMGAYMRSQAMGRFNGFGT
jgi:hypothetical protein